MRKLIRVRVFLQHAASHAETPSEIDAMIAIHGLDNTVENVIRTLAAHLDYEGVSGKSFPESELGNMAGELNKFLSEHYQAKLPYFSEIKILRQTRNLVQHDAFSPRSDLDKHVQMVQRFFQRALHLVFALEPNALQLSQIVNDPTLKDRLAQAEAARSAKEYLEAVVACRDAFDYALLLRQATSNLRLQAVTAISRLDSEDDDTPRFFSTLVRNVMSLELGLDSFQHERFQDIVHHIPHEHWADWTGNAVLQRPWEARDADFCYGFVTDNILRWQAKDLEPLHRLPETVIRYDFEDFVDGQRIEQEHRFGCTFGREKSWLNLMIVTRVTKQLLLGLNPAKPFAWETRSTEDGRPRHRARSLCRIKHRNIRLACHRPELWEVAIEHVRVPFSYEAWKYPAGVETRDTPSINTGTVDELAEVHSIDRPIAQRLARLRNAAGKIRKESDLRKIKSITEQQIWWLTQFTRA